MTKPTFRVVLSSGDSCVLVALNELHARRIVESYLRDEPLDKGIAITRIEKHSEHRREAFRGAGVLLQRGVHESRSCLRF